MNIMQMKSGTKIRNKRSGIVYALGDYVNDVAREIIPDNWFSVDYINENTEDDHEVINERI